MGGRPLRNGNDRVRIHAEFLRAIASIAEDCYIGGYIIYLRIKADKMVSLNLDLDGFFLIFVEK